MITLHVTLAEPQHFSLVEKLLLVVLVAASGTAFWRRFGTVLDKILKSKKDAGFHLLMRRTDYVLDMNAVPHDYVLMGLDLRVEEEYAGVGE